MKGFLRALSRTLWKEKIVNGAKTAKGVRWRGYIQDPPWGRKGLSRGHLSQITGQRLRARTSPKPGQGVAPILARLPIHEGPGAGVGQAWGFGGEQLVGYSAGRPGEIPAQCASLLPPSGK